MTDACPRGSAPLSKDHWTRTGPSPSVAVVPPRPTPRQMPDPRVGAGRVPGTGPDAGHLGNVKAEFEVDRWPGRPRASGWLPNRTRAGPRGRLLAGSAAAGRRRGRRSLNRFSRRSLWTTCPNRWISAPGCGQIGPARPGQPASCGGGIGSRRVASAGRPPLVPGSPTARTTGTVRPSTAGPESSTARPRTIERGRPRSQQADDDDDGMREWDEDIDHDPTGPRASARLLARPGPVTLE
jgi:hypothetical protein